MKTVGYRSRSLPSHSSRNQVRKSHSMRTSSTFKPANTSTPPNKNTNPYAQPIKASRSHSTAGKWGLSSKILVFLMSLIFLGTRERKKRSSSGGGGASSNVVILAQNNGPPPIPEPDYSCSESEAESDEERKDMSKLQNRLSAVQLHPVENSGNSNTRYAEKIYQHPHS